MDASTRERLLKELVTRKGTGSFMATGLADIMGNGERGAVETVQDMATRRLIDTKYINVQGQDGATWMISITQKGRDWLEQQGESDAKPEALLRELADAIERGDYAGNRAMAVAFEDGTMARLGCTRARAVCALLAAAVKGSTA